MCDVGFPEGTELFGRFGEKKKQNKTTKQTQPQQIKQMCQRELKAHVFEYLVDLNLVISALWNTTAQ